jgi:hypothetical protein
MIAAFISDENYLALPEVSVDCVNLATGESSLSISSASGALRLDMEPARYRLMLAQDGFNSKWIDCELGAGTEPLQQ